MRLFYKKSIAAFTLAEVLIAASILFVITGMTLNFTVEHLRSGYISEQKNQLNHEVKRFTQELSINAKDANYFRLYNSFDFQDRNTTSSHLTQGNAGDFLLLVHLDEPEFAVDGVRAIKKIVGYFLDLDNNQSQGPLRRFSLEFSPSTTELLENLIPKDNQRQSFPIIISKTQGVTNQKLFYNLWDKSILVSGFAVKGNDSQQITETYKVTISPRG